MILVFGDSIANGYPFTRDKSFPNIVQEMTGEEVRNFGGNGRMSADVLRVLIGELHEIDFYKENAGEDAEDIRVFIMCGSNDMVMGGKDPGMRFGSRAERMDEDVREALKNIEQMIRECKTRKLPVTAAAPPLTDPEKAARKWMPADYDNVNEKLAEFREELYALCVKEGAGFMDVQGAYKECGEYVDGVHPTEEGQRLIARMMVEKHRMWK